MRKVVTLSSTETPEEQRRHLETAIDKGMKVEATIKASAIEPIGDVSLMRGRTRKTIAVVHVVLKDNDDGDDVI